MKKRILALVICIGVFLLGYACGVVSKILEAKGYIPTSYPPFGYIVS